jgi:hypothetical protein
MAELDMGGEWIGKHNREVQTPPVLHLRESAQRMGLLRKNRGKLLLTARGRRLRTDPVGLWWHIAERVPPTSSDPSVTQAGLILLIAVAAGVPGDVDPAIARTLQGIGWVSGDGSPITAGAAAHAAWDTRTVLRRLAALTGRPYRGDERPTPGGVAFARAALCTWP